MLKTIIFDCDGVIADTEPLHLSTLQQTLEHEGISITKEEYYRYYLALDDRGCFNHVFKRFGVELTDRKLEQLMQRKAAVLEPIMRKELKLFPGVVDFIRAAAARFPLAVASGALAGEIDLILKHADVRDCFKVIVSAEDVRNGKPHPEPFIKALSLINSSLGQSIQPGECLVIEDSVHGVEASRLAGMRCLAVTNSYDGGRLSQADIVAENLAEISLDQIETALAR